MATELTTVNIGGVDRSADVLRVELWRTVSSIGNWLAVLRNTGGKYNGVFDVQDQFLLNVDGAGNTLMQGRVDGPAVTLEGIDGQDEWDEYILIRGVDQAQDLLFHNDFDQNYPDISTATQQVKTIWNDVINVQLAGLTNITYAPPVGATPAVGSFEFKEGTNFLAATQDLFSRAGYVFYVDDALAFQSGAPGFSASGVTLKSVGGASDNNILDTVELYERDGDKHYNYIKLYGKNPMFDGYTEGDVVGAPWLVGWHPWQIVLAGNMSNDATTTRVGAYSIVAWNNNPVNQHIRLYYTLPYNNYTTFDFSAGELTCWARYDNTAGAPGTPGAGTAGAGGGWPNPLTLFCRLTDNNGFTADYFGRETVLYLDRWGYCRFPLGQSGQTTAGLIDEWFLSNLAFDWNNVVEFFFSIRPPGGFAAAQYPSHVYIDGIGLPEPCIAIDQNAGAQATYRKRPFVDYYQHINTQLALDEAATKLLDQHESTAIDRVELVTEGNLSLRYAGQSVTVNVPSMGLSSEVMYMTQIHHIIEPHVDISGGFGFDWVTEVDAVPTSGVAYDMGRLRDGPVTSSTQNAARAGTGIRIK